MKIILRCEQQTQWPSFSLQRLPLTRAFKVFFFREFSWTSINCFHGFTRALTEKVPSSLNEGRIISNDDGFLNYFIKMKDYIVKTTRSLRAEWNSRNILYSLRNGFQVVYLFDVWKHGSRGRLNCNRTQIIITIVVSFGIKLSVCLNSDDMFSVTCHWTIFIAGFCDIIGSAETSSAVPSSVGPGDGTVTAIIDLFIYLHCLKCVLMKATCEREIFKLF